MLLINNVSPKTMSIPGVHSLKFETVTVYIAQSPIFCIYLGIKRKECDQTSYRIYTDKYTNCTLKLDNKSASR